MAESRPRREVRPWGRLIFDLRHGAWRIAGRMACLISRHGAHCGAFNLANRFSQAAKVKRALVAVLSQHSGQRPDTIRVHGIPQFAATHFGQTVAASRCLEK